MSTAATTLKTSDAFVYLPASPSLASVPTVVFFITGNPGLISYYNEFLSLLCQSPADEVPSPPANSSTSSAHGVSVDRAGGAVIAGFSLGGFELEDIPPAKSNECDKSTANHKSTTHSTTRPDRDGQEDLLRNLAYPSSFERKSIYGLRDQIELCLARLDAVVNHVRERYVSDDTPARTSGGVNVILAGHSVGAYIALELVRMHRARQSTSLHPASVQFDIVSAVLLTPTIVDIARSASGRVAGPLLSYVPFLPGLAQLASSGLAGSMSRSGLRWLVGRVTGMKEGGGLEATVGFLGKGGCVKQALWLAGDEMREIKGNVWGREVWGVLGREEGEVEVEDGKAPKLYFWFAGRDHWVADVTRAEIVKHLKEKDGADFEKMVEGSRYGRPEIVIDEDQGLVHAWCIEQSLVVAERVKGWIEQSLEFKR